MVAKKKGFVNSRRKLWAKEKTKKTIPFRKKSKEYSFEDKREMKIRSTTGPQPEKEQRSQRKKNSGPHGEKKRDL